MYVLLFTNQKLCNFFKNDLIKKLLLLQKITTKDLIGRHKKWLNSLLIKTFPKFSRKSFFKLINCQIYLFFF